MKFDDFLKLINDWGKFQKVKYTIICLTYMLPAIMVYTYSFTAATPNFRCRNPLQWLNDSYSTISNSIFNEEYRPTKEQCLSNKKSISLKECQRCFIRSTSINNQSIDDTLKSCQSYVFDRQYYKETLTEKWTMVCNRVSYRSWVQMIFFVGYMVGSILFGILADKYGRRPIMSVSFILMSFSGLLCTFAPQQSFGFWPSYIIFVLARFLLACSTRGISVSGFVLASEIVGPKKRLLTGIVIEYFFAFGQMILLIFAYFIRSWRILTLSIALFTVPYIFFYFILPESPRWLISKGRFDEGEKILRHIAKINNRVFNNDAYKKLKDEQIKNMSEKNHQQGIRSLFQSKIMTFISINLFFQWLVQNLIFYGISQSTGSWQLNPYLSFGVSAFVELLSYIFVHLILDRIGRKIPYVCFLILFCIVSILILPIEYLMEKDGKGQLLLLNIINGTLKFLSAGSYAIIYIYANELFPTNVRNTGMGICSMVARIGAIIGTYSNDNLTRLWIHLPILFYGSVSIIAALLALIFPETLNQPLPQTVDDVEKMNLINIRIYRSKRLFNDNIQLNEQSVERFTNYINPQFDNNENQYNKEQVVRL
ncbi:unnamed protein product [Rotaria sordida]|uniref:Major facilitator superfamily (MFS) profile domain-containing protein n=1 Tax=Rotaria sordida TaxID=392033 RepID=A0A815G8U0_9BILA|nr:unnamed protein product [Rotaria sordida]CAF1335425.1 unnamed protein product [Rotaria sordida]